LGAERPYINVVVLDGSQVMDISPELRTIYAEIVKIPVYVVIKNNGFLLLVLIVQVKVEAFYVNGFGKHPEGAA
jgi:hypothetical protein